MINLVFQPLRGLFDYLEHSIGVSVLVAICVVPSSLIAQGQSIKSTETTQSIETYPFGDPSPVPILSSKPEIYPYFRFDGYTSTSQSQKWKVIDLENKHIKLSVLPQEGGKVFGAVDKTTGKEFIYTNDVLKFRDIGLRGPWASGGIEFNFGYIGHTPTTATPVNYIKKKNEDGSLSIFVGGLDLASRTKWRVEIRLPKDKAYFKTNSFWYNPTSFPQSYYQWMNAAITAGNDLKMYFPGTHHIFHDGKGGRWPVNEEGINISQYKNNAFGSHKSYHVLGEYQDYSAAYWHNSDFGYGHWSRHDEMPGQKVWMWAQSRSGAIWEDLLTDSSGQYVEVQSGRLFNQANLNSGTQTPFGQYLFQPQVFDRWQEYWFPIRKTGGVSDASPYGTMNVQRDEQELHISFHAIQKIDDRLTVKVNGKIRAQKNVRLQPNEVYETAIPLAKNIDEYSVTIGNYLGYTYPGKNNLQRPIEGVEEDKVSSSEHIFQRAEEQLALRKYNAALSLYKSVIKEAPNHRRALTRIAELYTRRAEYRKALKYLSKVLKQDTYDASANFVYGTIKQKMGGYTQAKDAFGWAARSMEYRSAGFAKMAELYLTENNFQEAFYYADKALSYNTYNLAARRIKAITYRLTGKSTKAQQEISALLEMDPLSNFARFEQYLLEPRLENRQKFTSHIRSEMPHETFLELAISYYNMGRIAEAKKVLALAPADPVVKYWQAYLHKHDSSKNKQYLQQAVEHSPRLVYPFRSETIEVLEWAIKQNEQWQGMYYLGLIMWHKGRQDRAANLFAACGTEPTFAPFYVTRGKLVEEKNAQQARQDFEHALDLDPGQWRSYRAMGQWYLDQGSVEKAIHLLEKAYQKFSDNYYLGMQLASALNMNRKFSRALKVLENLTVLPYEGAQRGHQLYEDAHLMLALEKIRADDMQEASHHIVQSRQWPEHLGVGRPYNPDNRFQDYLESLMYHQQQKNLQKAERFQQEIASYTNKHWTEIQSKGFTKDNFVSYLVLDSRGENKKAETLLNQFEQQLGQEDYDQLELGSDSYSSEDTSRSSNFYWLDLFREVQL